MMMRPRIAIWIHGGVGGGQFSQGQPPIQQLIGRLAKHYSIDLYSVLPPNKNFSASGFALHTIRNRLISRKIVWLCLIVVFFWKHLVNRYNLVYSFWGYPAGVVAVWMGRLLGIPSIVHLQGGDAVAVKQLGYGVFCHPIKARIVRATYENCSSLIALSEYQAHCVRDNQVRKVPMVISFGPDSTIFKFQALRFKDRVTRFLHVGNLTPVKGQDVLLRVFSKIVRRRQAHLMIVGGDYTNGSLERYCESLGIREYVEFAGPQPHSAMPSFYHNADILLHTAWYEGQGVVVAEASSCGTIVAGTAVGMLADMGETRAILTKPGEAELLAEKVLDFIDAGDYQTMQNNARRWVEEKDVNYTERNIVNTINKLLYVVPGHVKTSVIETQR